MKLCLACKEAFDSVDWACPACAWLPGLNEGFLAFSPEMANENDGMHADAHHVLDALQDKSFWFRGRNKLIQDNILKFFPKTESFLEIGCGSGYVLSGIRSVLPSAKLTATEIYSYGLEYASQRVSSPSQFLQVDARKLPFKEEFDLIGAFDVLEHIEEDELVVSNIVQALKPGGGIIFTVPQHPWLWSKVDDHACHKRRYTRKQLAALLRKQGLEILVDTSFISFLLPFMLVQRLLGSRKKTYDPAKELALPKMVDKIFEMCFTGERHAIKAGLRLPIGGSRLVVARRQSTEASNVNPG